MQIIDPTYITDATLVSSDIPEVEAGFPEWDAVTNYPTGKRVSVTAAGIHKQYESMWGTGNTNMYPPTHLSGTPTYWMQLYATNRWRLFDMIVAPARATGAVSTILAQWDAGISWEAGTAWSADSFSSLQVTVLPGLIDTVALINVDATSIIIILTDPSAGEVYNEVKVPTTATNFNAIYSDLPAYPNATLQITARNTAGPVAVGELIVGTAKTLGSVRYGINIGMVDFSQKETDAFGNFSITERAYSKRVDCTISMPTLTHAGIMRILEKYRTTPLVWILDNQFSTLVAYGYYRDFRFRPGSPNLTECSLSIEGLGGDLIRATPVPDPWVDPWDGINRLDVTDIFHALWDNAVAVSTAKIEEAPVTEAVPGLTALGLPTVATPILHSYANLGTCTISNGSPAVVSIVAHGLDESDGFMLKTSGALPAPLVVDTRYYVKNRADDSFNLSLTAGGSTVDTTTAGSGTHTLYGED